MSRATSAPRPFPPLAVVGAASLLPGSSDAEGFLLDLLAGRDLIRDVPPSRWLAEDYVDPDPHAVDKACSARGGFLDPQDFDPARFRVPPSLLSSTDASQLLALLVASRLLEDLRGDLASPPAPEATGVILGASSGTNLFVHMGARLQRPVWVKAMREAGLPESKVSEVADRIAAHYVPVTEGTFPGSIPNVIAGRVAHLFDLRGASCTVDAACASSLAALSLAAAELESGRMDLAITGGVDLRTDAASFVAFSRSQALSRTGDCRPFSAAADGTVLGEGVCMLAVRRLEAAEADGDPILAVVRGIGSSSDGRSSGIYAPRLEGQLAALDRAYAGAGFGPGSVTLLEAHGTGTPVGDKVELEALRTIFDRSGREDRQWCALGSVKSQIGHTKGAAGAAGLLKAVLALRHAALPPTLKAEVPQAGADLPSSPFYLSRRLRPWITGGAPRRAGVSASGFGGANYHVVVEEYRGPGKLGPRLPTDGCELLALAADSVASLAAKARALAEALRRPGFRHCAFASRREFRADAPHRLLLVASDAAQAERKLSLALERLEAAGERGFALPGGPWYGAGARRGRVACLFPGQGSHHLGMGRDLAIARAEALEAWDEAVRAAPADRTPLDRVVFPISGFDGEERDRAAKLLEATEWAQPAIAAASLATWSVLRALGLEPDAVAGHSLGELTAYAAAGAMTQQEALRVAWARGAAMGEAGRAHPGAMSAVLGEAAEVSRVLEGCPGAVVANLNGPGQTVISGSLEALAAAEGRLASAGLECRRLNVSAAFHSPLMAGAAPSLAAALTGVRWAPPRIPLYGTSLARELPREPSALAQNLVDQLTTQVRFGPLVEHLVETGHLVLVEVGPESRLTRMVQRIAGARATAVATDDPAGSGLQALLRAVAALAAEGVPLDLSRLDAGVRAPADPAAQPRPTMTVKVHSGNHANPYPPPGGAAAIPAPNPEQAPAPAAAAGGEIERIHAAYQASLLEGHRLWLETFERTMAQGQRDLVEKLRADYRAALGAPQGVALAPPPEPPRAPRAEAAPAGAARPLEAAPAAAAGGREPEGRPAAAPPDLERLVLDLVSEATGYPVAVLEPGMSLDADLGIDSIKRVEILSNLRERVPALPKTQPEVFARIRTLADIVALTRGHAPSPPGEPEPAPPAPAAPDAAIAIEARREVVVAVDCPRRDGRLLPDPAGGTLWIAGGSGAAEALARLLRAEGHQVQVGGNVPADVAGGVLLHALDAGGDPARASGASRASFLDAQRLAPRLGEKGGFVVAAQDSGGEFGRGSHGAAGAWCAGMTGLLKTLVKEHPAIRGRVVDIHAPGHTPDSLAAALHEELLRGGDELEIGLPGDGRRLTLALAPRALPEVSEPFAVDGLWVVTGGARGVAHACVRALAEKADASFLVLGRTPLPEGPDDPAIPTERRALRAYFAERLAGGGARPTPAQVEAEASRVERGREARAAIAGLESLGTSVAYRAVDVRDSGAVAREIAAARARAGPVRGVVHAAGVTRDGALGGLSAEDFDLAFETKVGGLRSLLAATEEDPLSAIVLFSSLAGRVGNPGQAAYAMANEVLNRVAWAEARRRGGTCRVCSINWGPWEGGMVTPELGRHLRARGVPLLTVDLGARLFVDEVTAAPAGDVEVVLAAAHTREG